MVNNTFTTIQVSRTSRSQRELIESCFKTHTCTHDDVQPHYELLQQKNEQFTHQKLSSTALVNFTWSPGNLPSRDRTRNPPWESPRHRSPIFSPLDLLFYYFFRFFSIIFLYSGPESVSGSPQAAAELWGGKHCGSVTSGHFRKLFFFNQRQLTGFQPVLPVSSSGEASDHTPAHLS